MSKTSILLWGVLLSSFVPICLFTGNNNLEVLNIDGSSYMKPMIEFLISKIENKDLFINVSSVGSNMGMQKIVESKTDVALVSHGNIEEIYSINLNDKKLKKVEIGKEAMLILYKPPDNCNSELMISTSNIKDIYSIFSGWKYSKDIDPKINLKDLISGGDESCSSNVSPLVKSLGPIKSGSAKAFVENPLLTELTEKDFVLKVKKGYGSEVVTLIKTSESNVFHWKQFVENLSPGKMTYFPSSFVFKNKEDLDRLGIKIAKVKYGENEISIKDKKTLEDNLNSYKWIRTLNLIYYENLEDKKKKLVEDLVKKLNLLKDAFLVISS